MDDFRGLNLAARLIDRSALPTGGKIASNAAMLLLSGLLLFVACVYLIGPSSLRWHCPLWFRIGVGVLFTIGSLAGAAASSAAIRHYARLGR